MSSKSQYLYDPTNQLGAWNWGKIGNIIGDVSGAVSNFTSPPPSPSVPLSPSPNDTPLPAGNIDTTLYQPSDSSDSKLPKPEPKHAWYFWPAVIGSGTLATIGIITAISN